MGRSLEIFVVVLGVVVCEVLGEGSGYFLFTPPFGGDKGPQEAVASRRSGGGKDVPPSARSITPSESLWVGSHNINWSPLPLFQKFIEHHQQKKQRWEARKFEAKEHQKPFLISGGRLNDPYAAPPAKHLNNKPAHNPHHDFASKFSAGGFFAGLFGKHYAPQPQKFAEARSSIAPMPERDNYGPQAAYSQPPLSYQHPRGPPTTPGPLAAIRSSTGGTILVSPPGTVAVLSTPGPSLTPIVDRLRKMTEWSKKTQKTQFIKKEGTPKNYQEHKLRLKKRFRRPEAKQHKNNIEAIILGDDTEEDTSVEPETNKDRQLSKSKVLRVTSKESSEEEAPEAKQVQSPHRDLVIIHPTNAANMEDPLEVQQSALKSYHLRKDKQLGIFREENTNYSPVSFRFGAEDAKVNPYV